MKWELVGSLLEVGLREVGVALPCVSWVPNLRHLTLLGLARRFRFVFLSLRFELCSDLFVLALALARIAWAPHFRFWSLFAWAWSFR